MPNILVIDDEPDLRRLIEVFLQMEGYDVRTATNGREALESIRQRTPDLILCDMTMPGGVSGVDVLRAVRSSANTRGTAFVFVSGHVLDNHEADAILHKPFDPDEMIRLVRTLLQKYV
jgi:CheY-like chemotaxis protein